MAWIRSADRAYQTSQVSAIVVDQTGKIGVVTTGGVTPLTDMLKPDHARRAFDAVVDQLARNLTVIDLTQVVTDTK